MRRKIICLSVVALMSITAMAQLEKGSFYYIPRIGLSLSNLTHQEIYAGFNEGSNKSEGKWKAGVVAGIDLEYMVANPVGISVGVFYQMQGCRHSAIDDIPKWNTTLGYLNLPIMAHLYVGNGFSFNAGIQPGLLLQQKDDVYVSGYKKMDFAIPVGVGYEFSNGWSIDARYNWGLNQISKAVDKMGKVANNMDVHNRTISVTVGYRIPLR